MTRKYQSPQPNEKDVVSILQHLQRLLDAEMRFIIPVKTDGTMVVKCEIYKVIEGERLGLASYTLTASEGGYTVINRMYHTALKAYYDVEGLATGQYTVIDPTDQS